MIDRADFKRVCLLFKKNFELFSSIRAFEKEREKYEKGG
jgi:hypothetical protein